MDKYLDLKNKIEFDGIEAAANVIKSGGLVLFPTETVYGLGANGLNEAAVKNIFVAKGRKQDNPLILHVSSYEMVEEITQNISDIERQLMDTFWPGPFTIVLDKKEIVPTCVTSGLDTVGVRMPSNKIAHELIKLSGVPIAAPSANISGRPSGTNLQDIFGELADKVDFIIDGGECKVGVESTVVIVVNNIPVILRPGGITPEMIQEVVGVVEVDKHILGKIEEGEKVMSPGMKYRHYAPNSKCILVYSKENDRLVNRIKEITSEYKNPLIISSNENKNLYNIQNVIDMGSKNNLSEIAQNIFTILRKVDSYNPDIVVIEGVSNDGIGLAIMNRLIRACEYNLQIV